MGIQDSLRPSVDLASATRNSHVPGARKSLVASQTRSRPRCGKIIEPIDEQKRSRRVRQPESSGSHHTHQRDGETGHARHLIHRLLQGHRAAAYRDLLHGVDDSDTLWRRHHGLLVILLRTRWTGYGLLVRPQHGTIWTRCGGSIHRMGCDTLGGTTNTFHRGTNRHDGPLAHHWIPRCRSQEPAVVVGGRSVTPGLRLRLRHYSGTTNILIRVGNLINQTPAKDDGTGTKRISGSEHR